MFPSGFSVQDPHEVTARLGLLSRPLRRAPRRLPLTRTITVLTAKALINCEVSSAAPAEMVIKASSTMATLISTCGSKNWMGRFYLAQRRVPLTSGSLICAGVSLVSLAGCGGSLEVVVAREIRRRPLSMWS
jgi:hypothetical protein